MNPITLTLTEKAKPFLNELNPKACWLKNKKGTKTKCINYEDCPFEHENGKAEPPLA